MEEQELERIIQSHRQIAIACGVCLLLFGVVRVLTQPAGLDPIIERVAVAFACFSYAVLSYTRYVRKFPALSITVLASIVGAFVVYLAYLSNFNANSCFTVLVAVFACALLMGTSWSLVLFLGSNFAVVTVLLYLTTEPEVDPIFFSRHYSPSAYSPISIKRFD